MTGFRAELMKQDNAITIERVRILYERSFASISTAIVGAFIFAYIFREEIASPVLLAWLGFMFIVTLVRYWLLFDYNKNKQNTLHHDKFEKRFIYATGLIGIGWAFFIVTGLNLPTFEYRIYSLLLLTGIVALSVPIFSSSIRTIYFYITPSLIISIPLLLSRGGENTALGIAMIIFTVMVIRSSKDIYNTLNDILILRFQTQEQTEDLKQLRYEKSVSEQRMEAIMDNSPAVIYAKDIDGRYIFINKKWEQLFDLEKTGIIGKTDYEIFPKEFADGFVRNDKAVLTSGHAHESEEIAPHKDGPHTYVTEKFPLLDDKGNPYAICGISTDITERKKMEDEINSSEQHLKLYREQAPMATIEWNTDFQVLDWNKAAEKMFGYSVDEVIGRNFVDFMLPNSAVVNVKEIWKSLMSQSGGEVSINENLTKDGRIILCEWHNTPLKDEAGKVIGAASIVQDITERKQQEEQIRRSQKMDALGKLTGGIAHDYNNMLGVVLGYAELLNINLADQPKLAGYVEQIEHAGNRGAILTSKLLSFSSNISTDLKELNINVLLQREKLMLEKTLTARINLVLDLAEGLYSVMLDENEFEDILLNICINAMHAIEGNGRLTLKTRNMKIDEKDGYRLNLQQGVYILLSIADTGSGMTKETKEQLFDPFYSTKGDEGTGLGLSQVYNYVKNSGGAIEVDSKIGKGSQFRIYFPKFVGMKQNEKQTEDNNDIDLSGTETVLIVDDEPALLTMCSEILEGKGYKVLCAESAKQALDILELESVDLLISDVIMPEMDGYELATIVQKKFPNIKIQMVSGFTDNYHLKIINKNLHKNLIFKPYQAQELFSKIRVLLG